MLDEGRPRRWWLPSLLSLASLASIAFGFAVWTDFLGALPLSPRVQSNLYWVILFAVPLLSAAGLALLSRRGGGVRSWEWALGLFALVAAIWYVRFIS